MPRRILANFQSIPCRNLLLSHSCLCLVSYQILLIEAGCGRIFLGMGSQLCMRLSILGLLAAMAVPQRVCAQFLSCSEGQSQILHPAQNVKITIADVEFSGGSHLTDDARTQLVSRIKSLDLHAVREGDDSDWLAQVEWPIRDALQRRGYFRALLRSRSYLIRSEADQRHYQITIEIDSGPQYRLDQITFSGATVFPIAELRKQFSLQDGDLFDVTKLRNGIGSITRIYRAKGFIDMISKREEKIDEKSRLANIVFKVDEGRQYHVRTVEARGLTSTLEQALKSQFVPGEVFDIGAFRNFVREHSPELPKAVPFDEAIQVRRGTTNATVDILVDFRPCPATYRDLNLPIEGR